MSERLRGERGTFASAGNVEFKVEAKVYCKARPQGPDDVQVIVRQTLFDEGGRVFAVYGLSGETGKWVRVAEGEPYPSECLLKVLFYATDEGHYG